MNRLWALYVLCVLTVWAVPTHAQTLTAAYPGKGVFTTPAHKDSIILADLVNQTADPIFDTNITQAIAIQLQRVPRVQVIWQRKTRRPKSDFSFTNSGMRQSQEVRSDHSSELRISAWL